MEPWSCQVNESRPSKALRGTTTGIVLIIEDDRGTVFSADAKPKYTSEPPTDTWYVYISNWSGTLLVFEISNVTSKATASGVDCVTVAPLNCVMGCLIPHPMLTNRAQIHGINRIIALLYQTKSDS
jgi:hypothetical protein